jgi:hypothetical protein
MEYEKRTSDIDYQTLMQNRRWHIETGDALDILRTMPDRFVDSIVTDPPYGIAFMGATWDSFASNRAASVGRSAHDMTDEQGKRYTLRLFGILLFVTAISLAGK